MSYCQRIEDLLKDLEISRGWKTRREVTLVGGSSFIVKIRVLDTDPIQECTVNLGAGITPGVAKTIRKWFCSVVDPQSAETEDRKERQLRRARAAGHGRWKTVSRPAVY